MTVRFCALASMLAVIGSASAAHAKTIKQIIAHEHRFAFSDGSSVFRLSKGGSFELGPLGMSGRTIKGVWRTSDYRAFVIYGRWSWINGASSGRDYRRMKLHISYVPGQKSRRVGMRREKVWPVYFVIEALAPISRATYLKHRRAHKRAP